MTEAHGKLLGGYKIIDISVVLNENTGGYSGDRPFRRLIESSKSAGESCNLSSIEMSLHIGTHIDFPYHFFDDGKTLDRFSLDRFILPAQLIDCRGLRQIDTDFLRARLLKDTRAAILKTRTIVPKDDSSQSKSKYSYLTADSARFLVETGIEIMGVDNLSADADDSTEFPVHHILLSSDCLIIENLDLCEVSEGRYTLIAIPLKIDGADASPVRAVLIDCDGIPNR